MAPAKDPDTLDQGKGRVNRGADAPDQTNSSTDAELGLGSVSRVRPAALPWPRQRPVRGAGPLVAGGMLLLGCGSCLVRGPGLAAGR